MMEFIDFFTEKTRDVLTIGYGNISLSDYEIISLFLTWTPVAIIVDNSAMWLRFTTDKTIQKRGFHVTLTEVDAQGKYRCLSRERWTDFFIPSD